MQANIINTEVEALKEYVIMLERENRALAIERDTVYRELDAINAELRSMDRLYEKNRQLREEVRRLNEINYHQNNRIMQITQISQEWQRQRNEVEYMNSQKHIFHQKIDNLQRTCNNLRIQKSQLQTKIQILQHQLNNYQLKNDQLNEQIYTIKISIDNIEKERSKSAVIQRQKQLYERKLQELASNYYKVEAILIQKQNQNGQLHFELSQACHQLDKQGQQYEKQGQEYENMKRMLTQRDIMIDCLQNQLEQLKTTIRPAVKQQMPEIQNISKVDLIRQANILVERVNFLQKENRGYNQEVEQDSKTILQLQELQMQYHNLLQNLTL